VAWVPPVESVVPPTLPPAPPDVLARPPVDEWQPIVKATNTNDPIPEINEARRVDMAQTPFPQAIQKTLASGTLLISGTVKNSSGHFDLVLATMA
jgi:hypothetical protein